MRLARVALVSSSVILLGLLSVVSPSGVVQAAPAAATNGCGGCDGTEDNPNADTVVSQGDTLSQMAADRGVAGGAQTLLQQNTSVLQDADTIYAGQQLKIDNGAQPPASAYVFTFTFPNGATSRLAAGDPANIIFTIEDAYVPGSYQINSSSQSMDGSTEIVNRSGVPQTVAIVRGGIELLREPIQPNGALSWRP